jgi:hypothetical protein
MSDISAKIDAYILANNLSDKFKDSLAELVTDCMEPVKKKVVKKVIHMCECINDRNRYCKNYASGEYADKWLCYQHLKQAVKKTEKKNHF